MPKIKIIVYADSAVVSAYEVLARAFRTTRSHVHRLGLEHGLDYARAVLEADHAKDALARRQVRVSPLLPEADGGLSSPSR